LNVISPPDLDSIYSVSDLNHSVSSVLEQEFGWIWVEGEISNLARPASGHLYFSLKDNSAQVSCAMFRGRNRDLRFAPDNGLQVLVRARVSLYEPRGNYQLIVDRMEESGDGALRRQFELLKAKLEAEGLFDDHCKKEIPDLPKSIALVTSASGAAIHDVVSVIARRFPSIPVKLYPVPVQGTESAPAICHALESINQAVHDGTLDCDVILLVRGGGSLEDLWSFNDEQVARAVFSSSIPVVSGVGHEVDVTIVDYVADLRAATPTAAAESVTPDQHSWLQTFDWYQSRLQQLIHDKLQRHQQQTDWLLKRLKQQHPQRQLELSRNQSNALLHRLRQLMTARLETAQLRLENRQARLNAQNPAIRVHNAQQTLVYLNDRLKRSMLNRLKLDQSRLSNLAATMHAISPLQTLSRGYSITTREDGRALMTAHDAAVNEIIHTRLNNGKLTSKVITVEAGNNKDKTT
jgi:exodeoxyribonuclease VII large subunit